MDLKLIFVQSAALFLVLSREHIEAAKEGNQVDFDKWKPGRIRLKELRSMCISVSGDWWQL